MSGSEVTVRPVDLAADEPALLELLTTALAGGPTGQRTAEFFRWKHRANPFGESPGLVAADRDGRVVAVRLFLRWEFEVDGRLVRAVRAVDTATHPEHRGRGLFKRLTLEQLDRLADDRTELVFNTPNGNSLPGYLRMGWGAVGAMPISIRPARPAALWRGAAVAARRIRGGPPANGSDGVAGAGAAARIAAVPACPFPSAAEYFAVPGRDEALDALLARARPARPDGRIGTRRSARYLRWRYAEAPGLDYRAITLPGTDGSTAVAFGRPRLRGGLTEFTLSEPITAHGDTAGATALLRAAARHSGCDLVTLHTAAATPARIAAIRAGYLTPPRIGMTLVARPLGPGGSADPVDSAGSADGFARNRALDPAGWRLALGDLEVF
jgi:GNAT superfamily N-acetyltransferase